VAVGLEDCLTFLSGFGAERADGTYLREIEGLTAADRRALARLRFTGDAWAVPEGRIVFENEPLIEGTAPIAEAQLVETYLLNQLTFQSAIASKAARCRLAARGRTLIDFGFRRTHGIDAAMAAARVSVIAGFAATSNIAAAQRYGLTTSGTMAHSYVEAFEEEHDAFRAFAEDFPDHPTFLVDTYDTEAGVESAIRAAKERGLGDAFSVRLDSGDLDALTRRVRRLLDDTGCPARLAEQRRHRHRCIALLQAGNEPWHRRGAGGPLRVLHEVAAAAVSDARNEGAHGGVHRRRARGRWRRTPTCCGNHDRANRQHRQHAAHVETGFRTVNAPVAVSC
jgi:nicotinate phosphoribosyltransferase